MQIISILLVCYQNLASCNRMAMACSFAGIGFAGHWTCTLGALLTITCESITFGSEAFTNHPYINSAPFTVGSLFLRCNTFDPEITIPTGASWRGLVLSDRYTLTGQIGGLSITTGDITPLHPAGNVWPVVSGTDRDNLDPLDPFLGNWSSPARWTSIVNANTTSPVTYNRFQNEFLGSVNGLVTDNAILALLANYDHVRYNPSAHVRGCDLVTPFPRFPLRLQPTSISSKMFGASVRLIVLEAEQLLKVYGTTVERVYDHLGRSQELELIQSDGDGCQVYKIKSNQPGLLFVKLKGEVKTFKIIW